MAAQIPTLDEIEVLFRRVMREEMRSAGPDVMTVEQAAAHTGRAAKTIRNWISAGLPVVRKGRRVHIRREDLAGWMAQGDPALDALVASFRRSG